MRGRQQVDRGRVVGKASIGERSSRRGLGKINVVPAIAILIKKQTGACNVSLFFEVGNRLFHFSG